MHFERSPLARACSHFSALPAVLCAATPALGGSRSATTPLLPAPNMRFERVLYDEPGDGALWAVGAKYKASFGPDGATFIPAFGAKAPKNYPHALSPGCVTVGGVPLAFEEHAGAQRSRDRVTFERGAFVERYDLSLDDLEQSFVFESLPRGGDLVLHIPIASELVGKECDEHLEFRGAFGTVTYGRAVAVDATGRRFTAATHLVDGSIEIQVGAQDIARATLPLVVDPFVTTLDVIINTVDTRNTDQAWDEFNGTWLITWSQAFSASDNDVYARTINPNGHADSAIDVTSVSWNTPRCAQLASAHQFLVVAATSGASADIWSRTLQPNGTINTLGAQVFISGGDAGAKTNPDVGGNSVSSTPSTYCVVWERVDPANGKVQIAQRLVTPQGGPVAPIVAYLTASTPNGSASLPTVSKSSNGNEWLVAFTYRSTFPLVAEDVMGVRIGNSGAILSPTFQVSTSSGTKAQAVASSFQTNSSRAMIAYKRRAGLVGTGEYDIWVALLDGASVLSNTNLSALENSGFQTHDQGTPAIDCDGQHFAVAYLENVSGTAWNALVDDVALVGNTVSLAQQRVSFQGSALADAGLQVAAARRQSGPPTRLSCVSSNTPGPGSFQLANYVLFAETSGGLSGFYCPGDGSVGACPCVNNGSSGRGCSNSESVQGAALVRDSGDPSTVEDSLVLRVDSLPSGAACLFFQGTTVTANSVFGDGLFCTGGTITRLAVKFAAAGSALFPVAGDATLSVAGGVPIDGGRRAYQVWYRDSAVFCTSATNNLSNGFYVDWAR